jgi:hypothetical protein
VSRVGLLLLEVLFFVKYMVSRVVSVREIIEDRK